MEKKRYWIKLDKDFLKSPQIKVIKNMTNGKDYILFYLALMLESVETIGHLRFSDLVPYNEEMLASITDTNVDIVRSAVKIFIELGLLEMLDDGTIYMTQVAQMTGKESDSAKRVRLYRLREKGKLSLQCNSEVTVSNDEVTISNEVETNSNDNKEKEKQSTENREEKQNINNSKEEDSVSASVNYGELNNFFADFEISEKNKQLIFQYLGQGMSLEVIKNAFMIPYDRNVMNFDFENNLAPIANPFSYSFQILNNWSNMGVTTLSDVKKYNKLNKNRTEMLGEDYDNS